MHTRAATATAVACTLLLTPAYAQAQSPSPSAFGKAAAPTVGKAKLAECVAQWKALGAAGQAAYNAKAQSMRSKSGGKMSGYNAYTTECLSRG